MKMCRVGRAAGGVAGRVGPGGGCLLHDSRALLTVGPEDTQVWYWSRREAPRSVGQARKGGAPPSARRPCATSVATRLALSSACDWARRLPATRTTPGQPLEGRQNGQRHKLLPNEVWSHGKVAWSPGQPQMAPAAHHRPRDTQEAGLQGVAIDRGPEAVCRRAWWGQHQCRPGKSPSSWECV